MSLISGQSISKRSQSNEFNSGNSSKLIHLVRETMSSPVCRISLIAHIQNDRDHLNECLQIVQQSTRIQQKTPSQRQLRIFKVNFLL